MNWCSHRIQSEVLFPIGKKRGGGGELLPTKFKLFIDIKSSKWIIIKNNTKLTLTQPEMLATRMGESWTHSFDFPFLKV
jgi:hypothetical protein